MLNVMLLSDLLLHAARVRSQEEALFREKEELRSQLEAAWESKAKLSKVKNYNTIIYFFNNNNNWVHHHGSILLLLPPTAHGVTINKNDMIFLFFCIFLYIPIYYYCYYYYFYCYLHVYHLFPRKIRNWSRKMLSYLATVTSNREYSFMPN